MEEFGLLPYTPEVPQTFHQLGILVLDGSGSMGSAGIHGISKAEEVSKAVTSLLERMSKSRVKNNFSFSCVMFDNFPQMIMMPTPLKDLNYQSIDFNPLNYRGGGTHIFGALEEAGRIAKDFLTGEEAEGLPHSVVILLMSDGMCFRPEQTVRVADALKRNPKVKIACAYFSGASDNDQEASEAINLLRKVASGPSYYATVHDGENLRKFFERSISQSSGTKL